MSNGKKVKWSLEADYLQACNCDYGCPCEFEARPTQGFCDGMGAWRINRGRYGKLSLDGLALGFVAHWPGALHEGTADLQSTGAAEADDPHAAFARRRGDGDDGIRGGKHGSGQLSAVSYYSWDRRSPCCRRSQRDTATWPAFIRDPRP